MDKEQHLESFTGNAAEEADLFGQHVLALENHPDQNSHIESLYISTHTLKGNTSSLEHFIELTPPLDKHIPDLFRLTHQLEDHLDALRTRKPEPSDINLLFEAHDLINRLVSAIRTQEITTYSEEVSEFLEAIPSTQAPPAPTETSPTNNRAVHQHRFSITLSPDEELLHPRLLIVYREIEELYTECDFNPSKEELLQNVDIQDISVCIHTNESITETQKQLNNIDNIEAVTPSLAKETSELKSTSEILSSSEETLLTPEEDSPAETLSIPTLKIHPKRIDNVLKSTSKLVVLTNKLSEFLERNDFLAGTPLRKDLELMSEEYQTFVESLQSSVLNIYMTPFDQLFSRFPMDVRHLSKHYNKPVAFKTFGGKTEIDKMILDELFDPLMHLIRNAVVHGIESPEERVKKGKPKEGTITIGAQHDKNKVLLTISDDGGGIDTSALKSAALVSEPHDTSNLSRLSNLSNQETLQLIFEPGLTTSKQVDSFSGRGVGMDSVRKKLHEIEGKIEVESSLDEGTTFIITLPLTTAIVEGMITTIAGHQFTFPVTHVEEVISLPTKNIRYAGKQPFFFLREEEIPYVPSDIFFGLREEEPERSEVTVMILRSHDRRVGFTIDSYRQQQNIITKSLHPFLQSTLGVGSAHLLGDGSISIVVDTNDILSFLTTGNQ